MKLVKEILKNLNLFFYRMQLSNKQKHTAQTINFHKNEIVV